MLRLWYAILVPGCVLCLSCGQRDTEQETEAPSGLPGQGASPSPASQVEEASARVREGERTPTQSSLPQEHVSRKYSLSMRYPAGWEIVFTDQHEAPWVKPVGIGGPKAAGGRPGFTLLLSAISSEGSIDRYMKKASADLERMFGRINVLCAEERKVNGYPAAWMEYTYRSGTMRELNVTLVMGRTRHVLMQFICECPADRFTQFLPVFSEMIRSVRLINDRLGLPHVVLTGVQKCGACSHPFSQAESKYTAFDAEKQEFLALCATCRHQEKAEEHDASSTSLQKRTVDAYLRKDFPEAVKLGSEWVKEKQDDPLAHFLLGAAYSSVGRQTDLLRHHGIACTELGGKQAILDWTAKLVARNPASAVALTLRGSALDLPGGKNSGSIEAYKKAISIEPDYPTAYFNLANVHKRNKNYDDARTVFETVIARVPHCARAYSGLGLLYDECLKQPGKAQEAYEKALAVDASCATALFNYANLQMRRKEHEKAKEFYLRAVKAQPSLVPAYVNLGGLYYFAGDRAKALESFRKASELDPDGQYGKAARANIRALTE